MKELTIPAKVDKLPEVLAFLEGYLEERDCPMKTVTQLCIALEEMFVNVAHYAYEGSELSEDERDAKIEMDDCTINGAPGVRITLYDRGFPYDPLAKEDPDTTLSAQERQIGGLGIYMVKKSMDNVSYRYEDGLNIFTMEKSF